MAEPILAEQPYIVSRLIRTEYLHREFPVLVARVKNVKRQQEQWGVSARKTLSLIDGDER